MRLSISNWNGESKIDKRQWIITFLWVICAMFIVSTANTQAAVPEYDSLGVLTASPSDAGNIVVYINWDGFANYYVDLAEAQGRIPTLSWIKNEAGVYFSQAYTAIPSITGPMQVAMVSGTTPRYTDNHFRYFHKDLNRVIQEQPTAKNEAETLAEAAVRQNLDVLAVHQFALQNRGTVVGDPTKAYISLPANGHSDAEARFDEAIRIIKTLRSGELTFSRLPRFIALYMDDLDGIGHNMGKAYGLPQVTTEEERKQAIVDRLEIMDRKLGEFIQACQEAGIYERMSFVLTTDHGMAPLGFQRSMADDSRSSKLRDLIAAIEALGPGYKCEAMNNHFQEPSVGTDIAMVTAGLQVQLSYIGEFNPDVINAKNNAIANALKDLVYIDGIMFPDEMISRGIKYGFADLIISPKPPYHFRMSIGELLSVRGQHDSLAEEAQHIAAFMWGKDIRKGYTHKERVHIYDFAPTMAKLLGINAPLDATGRPLYEILYNIAPPRQYEIKLEDEDAVVSQTTKRYWHEDASGGTATSLYGNLASFEYISVPMANQIKLKYAAVDNSRLLLFVNDQFIRPVFFPASGGSTKFEEKAVNLTLHNGDKVKFVKDAVYDGADISIDYVVFIHDYYVGLENQTPLLSP